MLHRSRPWRTAHASVMLLTLLLTLSATSFIATALELSTAPTAANEEADADAFSSALVSLDAQEFPVQTPPVEPDDDANSPNEEADADAFSSALASLDAQEIPVQTPPEQPDDCDNSPTLKCPSGEILDKCPSYCPSDFCPTGPGQNKRCSQPNPCPPPACKCGFNRRRAVNGTCIPTRDCPAFECSNPNEEYNSCPPLCPTDSCSQATPTGKCPLPGRIGIILECQPTCRCKKGYWKKDGICVPYNQCPGKLTCGANEVVDECPSDCASDKCPTSDDEQPQSCPKPCQCPPQACKCRFNYSRAPNGTCIPTRECPPFECYKPNEVYNSCPPYCPTDDCSQATPDGRCPLPGRIGITLQCRPKCRCKPGYWKLDGFCVPYEKCPGNLKCPPGEVVDNCPQLCNTDSCPKDQDDVRICSTPIRCVEPTCKCPFNHLRADNGTCIPADSCPPIPCNRPHEVYNPCPPACPSDDCSQATPSGECPLPGRIGIAVECRPSCRCEKGYWRQNGTCVPFGQCGLDCSGPNEEYACGGACDTECKTLNETCPIVNIRCNDKCYCKEGFARNDKGICIPISECPEKKNDTQCPFPNEDYTDCKKECPSDTCFSVVSRCIPSDTCSPGCVCSSGYLRKNIGEPCVPMCECPELRNTLECQKKLNCTGPNEVYACGSACDTECATLNQTCPIVNVKCNDKCYCKEGFARNEKGICIPISECPKKTVDRCPGENEQYSCVKDCPPQKTCRNRNVLETISCLQVYKPCEYRCVCKANHVRNSKGKCIPVEQCDKDKDERCPFPNEGYTDCKKRCPSDRCSAIVELCAQDDSCSPGCVCYPGFCRKADGEPCVPKCQSPEYESFPECQK